MVVTLCYLGHQLARDMVDTVWSRSLTGSRCSIHILYGLGHELEFNVVYFA